MLKRIVPFLLALLLLCPAVAAAEEALLNGSFDGGGGLQGWGRDAWNYGDVYTAFLLEENDQDGSLCATIENYQDNDARYTQPVSLEKDAVYRLSARVKFQGEGTCNLSVMETEAVSAFIHDTDGHWTTAEVYIRSGKRTEASIALRVGYYGRLERGKAWFDDVRLERVDAKPAGATVYELKTLEPAKSSDLEAPDKSGLTALVLGALFAIFALALYSAAARRGEVEKGTARAALAAILAIAFVLRAVVAWRSPGYQVDIDCFASWGSHLAHVGPWNFYTTPDYFCDYPPGYLIVLALLSTITQGLGLIYNQGPGLLILKLPAILSDVALCYLLYRTALKYINSPKWGLVAAALFALCPAVIADSAAWGQIDSVLTLAMALSILMMLERRMMGASIAFCIGVLIKPQALMFGPILLMAFIQEIKEEGPRGLRRLGACFGVCAALFIAVILPFHGGQHPAWILEKYFSTLTSYPWATINAMNLFGLLGGNWVSQEAMLGPLSYQAWGMIFMVATILYAFFLYILGIARGAADRRALVLCALVILCGIFSFGVRMHERYLYPALALVLIALVLYRDRRFLYPFIALATAQALNLLLVLAHEHIMGGDALMMIIGSTLHIAATAYLFYLAFAICVMGERAKGADSLKPFHAPKRQIVSVEQPTLHRPGGRNLRVTRVDVLLMGAVTLLYSALAFVNLGDTQAPKTSFRASTGGEAVVFDLGLEQSVTRFYYYGEIPEGMLEISFAGEDGLYGPPIEVDYSGNIMFMWKILDVDELARYARVTFDAPMLTFFEFGFTGEDGIPYPASIAGHTGQSEVHGQDPSLLIDEQRFVPERPTYKNSMYFDEIYHARTAYEHIHDIPWYESTHPPLGKVFMSWCIQALGMNPFAWRLAGTLAGIMMLPGMYMLGKLLFGRRELAFAAMFLMAVDCMHFAQTRIATIDSFPVLFIIWAYFFMFLYANMSFHHESLGRTLPPLLACGLFMGLGCASKWIGIYSAAGLAVIFLYTMLARFHEMLEAKRELRDRPRDARLIRVVRDYGRNLAVTLGLCVLFFIAIPVGIYYASYYQYLGVPGAGNDWRGVWNYQTHMLSYHSGVFDEHPYMSAWYQWPVIWKPMAFFFDYRMPAGWTSAISTFGNPAVWWAGLAALLWTIWRAIRGDGRRDPRILLVVIGFAAQYLPWVLVPRTTYIYHYFASVPFLILCVCFALERLLAKGRMKLYYGYLVAALILFALFYPLASGLSIPVDFAKLANWLPSWHLYWG